VVATLCWFDCGKIVRADDIRPRWKRPMPGFVAAFNTPDTAAFPDFITADAVLSSGRSARHRPRSHPQFWKLGSSSGGGT